MGSIQLHKTKGVNPFLTTCPRCGGTGPEIILVGSRDYKDICEVCGQVYIGGADPKTKREGCLRERLGANDEKVRCNSVHFRRESLEENEKLPGGLCHDCEAELKVHEEVVAAGGIYWKCADCKRAGVIKHTSPLAGLVRKDAGIEPPDPVGVEFAKEPINGLSCPACGPDAIVGDEAKPDGG